MFTAGGSDEMEDQQAKSETVDQQVQPEETIHQQGLHVTLLWGCYLTTIIFNIPRIVNLFWILRTFRIKLYAIDNCRAS